MKFRVLRVNDKRLPDVEFGTVDELTTWIIAQGCPVIIFPPAGPQDYLLDGYESAVKRDDDELHWRLEIYDARREG